LAFDFRRIAVSQRLPLSPLAAPCASAEVAPHFGSAAQSLALVRKDLARALRRKAKRDACGLGAGIWTQSLKRAHTMGGRIKAGTVWINTYRAVSFLMPFGGYKASGLGRENGVEAIDGYLQSTAS
jgi:hypothetical protein